MNLETVLSSTLLVAASEMGDKTQLLAFVLAAKFRRPVPIFLGIFVATVVNHLMASYVGIFTSQLLSPRTTSLILGAVFIAFGLWTLKPDTLDDDESSNAKVDKWGPFAATAVLFFMAEMGDKTQFATMALAARFQSVWLVTTGTTLGMLISDGLAVFLGDRLAGRINLKWMRIFTAALFILFGVWSLLSS